MKKKTLIAIVGGVAAGTIALVGGSFVFNNRSLENSMSLMYGVPDYYYINNRFEKYEGIIKGSSVKALLNEVITNNYDNDTEIYIYVKCCGVDCGTSVEKIKESKEKIKNAKGYNVEFKYNNNCICEIIISEYNEQNTNNTIVNELIGE